MDMVLVGDVSRQQELQVREVFQESNPSFDRVVNYCEAWLEGAIEPRT